HVDVGGDRGLERWDQGRNAIDGVYDVGARLAVEDDEHGGLAVGEPEVTDVLDRVLNFRDVRETHRRTVTVGDHQSLEFSRLARLVIGVQLVAPAAEVDRALGRVGVGRGERRTHIFKPDTVLEERAGIYLHAHRRQRAAAD